MGRRGSREREREGQRDRENSNSNTLFYKDCSLGSVKNLTMHRERGRETDRQIEREREEEGQATARAALTCRKVTMRHRTSPPRKTPLMSQASWGRMLQKATSRSAMLRCRMNMCILEVIFRLLPSATSTHTLPTTA